jgi:hypothetical protein
MIPGPRKATTVMDDIKLPLQVIDRVERRWAAKFAQVAMTRKDAQAQAVVGQAMSSTKRVAPILCGGVIKPSRDARP